MPPSAAGAPWLSTLLWVGSFLFAFATLAILNDHFHRISAARQIALYGELPFRDFLDPGYFMAELSSAALQAILGHTLLGDVLLTTASIATGTVLVFVLARRLSQSSIAGVTVAVMALLAMPRSYDYDKVVFYPLGILLCWRYAERPTRGRLWMLAAGLVAGALFRYDTGAYVAAAAIVSIAVVHAGEWGTVGRRIALFLAAVIVMAAPFALFLELNGGLVNVVDQLITYATREAARTQLARQHFSGADGWWTTANANVLVYVFLRALPLAATAALLFGSRSAPDARAAMATVLSLVVMSVLLNLFILRDPISARIGGMAGPPAVLSAWLVHRVWRSRNTVARTAVVAASCLIVWGVLRTADWHERLALEYFRPSHLVTTMGLYAASPPEFATMPTSQFIQMVQYLRECTASTDRVLLGWFAPEVYFFAERGFAAGLVVIFGEHWSEPRFQQRSLRTLASQSVPIVIVRTGDESFGRTQPLIARYLDDHYRLAGTTSFGDGDVKADGYTVLVRKDRAPSYIHPVTSMPCFW